MLFVPDLFICKHCNKAESEIIARLVGSERALCLTSTCYPTKKPVCASYEEGPVLLRCTQNVSTPNESLHQRIPPAYVEDRDAVGD